MDGPRGCGLSGAGFRPDGEAGEAQAPPAFRSDLSHRNEGVELLDRLAARPASGGCPTDPFSIRDVLSHLDEPVRPPAVHPARGPPELELGFAEPSADGMDPTPAVDPAEPEPIPPYEMDRTRAW